MREGEEEERGKKIKRTENERKIMLQQITFNYLIASKITFYQFFFSFFLLQDSPSPSFLFCLYFFLFFSFFFYPDTIYPFFLPLSLSSPSQQFDSKHIYLFISQPITHHAKPITFTFILFYFLTINHFNFFLTINQLHSYPLTNHIHFYFFFFDINHHNKSIKTDI